MSYGCVSISALLGWWHPHEGAASNISTHQMWLSTQSSAIGDQQTTESDIIITTMYITSHTLSISIDLWWARSSSFVSVALIAARCHRGALKFSASSWNLTMSASTFFPSLLLKTILYLANSLCVYHNNHQWRNGMKIKHKLVMGSRHDPHCIFNIL